MTDRDAIAHRYQDEADRCFAVTRIIARAWLVVGVCVLAWNWPWTVLFVCAVLASYWLARAGNRAMDEWEKE